MLGLDLKDVLQLALSVLAMATAAAAWLRKPGEDAQSEVNAVRERLVALEERTKHMPDSEELAKLEGMVKQIAERTEGFNEAIGGIRTSVARIENYLLHAKT